MGEDTGNFRKTRLMIIGTGKMARLFAKTFKNIIEVSVVSPIPIKAKRLAKKFGIREVNFKDAKDYNFILLAVSPFYLKEVALSIAYYLKPGVVVMDISSVKKGFVEEVLKVLPSDVGYVSLHPLFGPYVKKVKGETIVIIPMRGKWAVDKVLELMKCIGLRTLISSVEEHDKVMSIVQVAHHLSYLAYALTLAEAIDPQLIEKYATRLLRITLQTLKRMNRNLSVVREIQELNTYGQTAKMHLLENLKKLMRIDEETWRKVEKSLKLLTSVKLR